MIGQLSVCRTEVAASIGTAPTMCGRSRCSLSRQQVVEAAAASEDNWVGKDNYEPSHNVSPGFSTPVVKRSEEGDLQIHTMK